MADDSKRVNCVKVCFNDREYIDLGRLSAREDRKIAEMVRVAVCRVMYGILADRGAQGEGTNEDP